MSEVLDRDLTNNRLSVLAPEIKRSHEAVQRSNVASAEHAYRAGELLAEAKANEAIPRGGWERWVEQVACVPHETAKRYIQLFRAVSQGRVSIPDIAEAGQIGALKIARSLDDPNALRPTPGRDGPDFWPTPVTLVDACVRHVLPLLPHNMPIWEPAAGDRRLARAIEATGLRVYATDLYPQDGEPPVDFLDCIPPAELTCVVTNPPYNASDDFIDRCMALFDRRAIAGFALLLRHDHLQAGSRVAAFNSATAEVHCNWRPIWIDGTEGQPRWSFHWLIWTDGARRAPFYLAAAA